MKIFAASVLAALGIFLVFGVRSSEGVVPIFQAEIKMPKPKPELKMLVVGDIMLGRNVQLLGEKLGADYTFRNIVSFLKQYDIVVGNLEGSIIEGATRTPAYAFKLSFPTSSPEVLRAAGFNLLSLANNHTLDFGSRGYEETAARLAGAGIDFFGHPLYAGASYVKRLEQSGKRLAFFGYNATYPSFKKDAVLGDIAAERASYPDELIFVFMHWGEEYSLSANVFQKQLAREIIDAGGTAIFGSHPHVTEGVEIYKGRAIFYSLGNFIFDQYFSKNTQEELIISMKIGAGGIAYELIPAVSKKSQPELMKPGAREAWLKELSLRSDPAVAAGVSLGSIDLPL